MKSARERKIVINVTLHEDIISRIKRREAIGGDHTRSHAERVRHLEGRVHAERFGEVGPQTGEEVVIKKHIF